MIFFYFYVIINMWRYFKNFLSNYIGKANDFRKIITVLEEKRRKKNVSIHQLENQAGFARNTLRNIFQGKTRSPSLDKIAKVAQILDLDLIDVFIESLEIDLASYREKKYILPIKEDSIRDVELFTKCVEALSTKVRNLSIEPKTHDFIRVGLEYIIIAFQSVKWISDLLIGL